MEKFSINSADRKIPPFLKGGWGILKLGDRINPDIKDKKIFQTCTCFLILVVSLIYSCGKSPSKIPTPQVGAINVVAILDTVVVDSANIYLDGDTLGLQEIPFIIDNIIAGNHLVSISLEDNKSPIDYSCKPERVSVEGNKTNDVILALTKFAPDFSLYNLNDENIKLEDFKNKVVFLVFYSHTWHTCVWQEIPAVQNEIFEKYSPDTAVVLGLTRNETSKEWLLDYTTINSITFDMLYNASVVFEAYGALDDPTYVIIDGDGRLVFRASKYYFYRMHELTAIIDDLIGR